MRLLRLETGSQKWILEDFPGSVVPFYAILSHSWGADDAEVKFEDVQDGTRDFNDITKPGYDKLRFCQKQVERSGLRYFWIDTCCIKKSDSSELQRSLNSMFYWYQRAAICYVYLSDVSINDWTEGTPFKWLQALTRSRWFTRGWTLQELLAPPKVTFFSNEGESLGDKQSLATTIATITQIPTPALRGVKLSQFSQGERFSWATNRQTTMPEDSAYCLIGIFDVQLHMLYADGDYEKRKKVAMDELNRAIDRSLATIDSSEDVIRIGGANWNDLNRLGQRQLWKLDADLDGFRNWLLDTNPAQGGDFWGMTHLARGAGKNMKDLLRASGVRYNDLSELGVDIQNWTEPWKHYRDKSRSDQERVQGLIENRWYWTKKNEEVYTLITALRTFEDLMIWRGKWKK